MWRRLLQLCHFPQGEGLRKASFCWWKRWGRGQEFRVSKKLGLGAWIWVFSQLSLDLPGHSFCCFKIRGAGPKALLALIFYETKKAFLELQFRVSPQPLSWSPWKHGSVSFTQVPGKALSFMSPSALYPSYKFLWKFGARKQFVSGLKLAHLWVCFFFSWLDDICDTLSVFVLLPFAKWSSELNAVVNKSGFPQTTQASISFLELDVDVWFLYTWG